MAHPKSFRFNELAEFVAAGRTKDAGFRSQIKFWIDRFGDRDIRQITLDDVEDGLDDLRRLTKRHSYYNPATGESVERISDKSLSNSTINKYLNTLGGVWKTCHADGFLRKRFQSPTKGIGRLKEDDARVIDVSVADIMRLVAAARLSRNRKLAGYVAFAATTGWRSGNMKRLIWAELDLDKGQAKASTSKTGTPHWVPLIPFVVEELRKMRPDTAQPGDLVFGAADIKRTFATTLERAGFPDNWTPHCLRHAAASGLTQSGAPIQTVAAALNHKTLAMAARYSHQNTDQLRTVTFQSRRLKRAAASRQAHVN